VSKESRRKLLKGLAVTLPAAWTTPLVESIVLPAHAETSPGDCSAPADCYAFQANLDDWSFEWPGGPGPEVVDIYEGRECSGEPIPVDREVVVAESLEAAQEILTCSFGEVFEIETVPPLDNGCSFYLCPFLL
jgi:hypothetical protein